MSFQTVVRGKLEYLVSTQIGVPHCFTTRHGGVSTGTLASLNLGTGRGDSREHILENYRILGEAIGFRPEDTVFTRQVHTDRVDCVGRTDCGCGLFRPLGDLERDALVTDVPGVVLTAFTADCTPILLHDPVRGVAAAVHSGWRGTALGIVGRTVDAMQQKYGSEPKNIRAAIGPCISECCFETHREVPDAMLAALGADALPAIKPIPERQEKYRVDLKLLNKIWLQKSGVETVDVCPDCTACRPDRFWSHRRTGGERGSLAALIMLPRENTNKEESL